MEPEQEDSSFRLLLGGGSVQPQETASASGCVPKAPRLLTEVRRTDRGPAQERSPFHRCAHSFGTVCTKGGQVARARRGAVRGSNLESVEQ